MGKRALSEEPSDTETRSTASDSKRFKSDASSSTLSTQANKREQSTTPSTDSKGEAKSNFGLSDILLVEHAIGNIQVGLKTVLDNAPTEIELAKLKEDPDNVKIPEIVLGLNRSKLLLASKIKTLHQEGKLQILDNIINFEKDLVLNKKNVDVSVVSNLKQTSNSVEERNDGIPTLPEIKNNAIKAQVFMHKSVIKPKLFLSEADAMSSHNERLEFIGDSFLNTIMTQIIVNEFPHATEGELSTVRSKLVNNNTLQKWSQLYGLDKKLKMVVDESMYKGKLKIYADVFEAYVGGLILEDPSNYSVVHKWLLQLAQPIIKEYKKNPSYQRANMVGNRNSASPTTNNPTPLSSSSLTPPSSGANSNSVPVEEQPLNPNAKVELYSLIGYAKLGLHYENIGRVNTGVDNIILFTVNVKTKDGEVLGVGQGKNIKEAGTRAAMAALANKPLIEKYSLQRASIPREQSTKPADVEKTTLKLQKKEKKDSSKAVINSEDHKSKMGQSATPTPVPEVTEKTNEHLDVETFKKSENVNDLLGLLQSRSNTPTFTFSNNNQRSSGPSPSVVDSLPKPTSSQILPVPNASKRLSGNNNRTNGYSRPRGTNNGGSSSSSKNYGGDRF